MNPPGTILRHDRSDEDRNPARTPWVQFAGCVVFFLLVTSSVFPEEPTPSWPVTPESADQFLCDGNDKYAQGDLQGAEKNYRIALDINQKLSRADSLAAAWCNLGHALLGQKKYDEAERSYEAALRALRESDQQDGIAELHSALGWLFRDKGDNLKAEASYKQALAINEKLGRTAIIAHNYADLGSVSKSDPDRAAEYYQKSLALEEKLGNPERVASRNHDLGNIYSIKRDWTRAKKHYEVNLAYAERHGSRAALAAVCLNLGRVRLGLNESKPALELFDRAIAIWTEVGDKAGLAETHLFRSLAAENLGEHWSSCESLKVALHLFRTCFKTS